MVAGAGENIPLEVKAVVGNEKRFVVGGFVSDKKENLLDGTVGVTVMGSADAVGSGVLLKVSSTDGLTSMSFKRESAGGLTGVAGLCDKLEKGLPKMNLLFISPESTAEGLQGVPKRQLVVSKIPLGCFEGGLSSSCKILSSSLHVAQVQSGNLRYDMNFGGNFSFNASCSSSGVTCVSDTNSMSELSSSTST